MPQCPKWMLIYFLFVSCGHRWVFYSQEPWIVSAAYGDTFTVTRYITNLNMTTLDCDTSCGLFHYSSLVKKTSTGKNRNAHINACLLPTHKSKTEAYRSQQNYNDFIFYLPLLFNVVCVWTFSPCCPRWGFGCSRWSACVGVVGIYMADFHSLLPAEAPECRSDAWKRNRTGFQVKCARLQFEMLMCCALGR